MDGPGQVSVPKEYFDTLVRRASLHAIFLFLLHSRHGQDQRDDAEYLFLQRRDYDDLLRASREYQTLRATLTAGGLTQESLDILVGVPTDPVSPAGQLDSHPPTPDAGHAEAQAFLPNIHKLESIFNGKHSIPNGTQLPPTPPSLSSDLSSDGTEQAEVEKYCEIKEQYENNCEDRSVVLRGLSPDTTLADIAQVIRGGQVLNMFIRRRYGAAHIAFVNPLAAEKFLIHSKHNDIYLKAKRIEVDWDERQHYMPGHIARRTQNGATRNLVLRSARPDMTPDSLRDDLEHIHNLEVVNITMENGHAFISLNGINWAVTAKNCMTSRLKYKGTKIEFFPDECDQSLPLITKKQYKPKSPKKFATLSVMNNFALLAQAKEGQFEDVNSDVGTRNIDC